MADPNTDWGEILTTTMYNRSKKLAESISQNNKLLASMKKNGGYRPVSGGESIIEEHIYAENGTYTRYSGGEPLNIDPSTSISAFSFGWKQAAVAVTATGLEIDVQNAGPEQVIDLLDSRLEIAEITFENELTADLYSDGTASGGKQVGGLQHLVPDDPTAGTVGGVSRVNYNYARSKVFRGVTDGGAAVSAANIVSYMNQLYVQLVLNSEKPNLILADNDYFLFYEAALQPIQRISGTKSADAGFEGYDYKGVPVMCDEGLSGNIPGAHMYMLNTRKGHISYRPHKDRDIVPLKPDRFSTNQDAMVKLMAWAGNMTVRTPRLQGVLIA